MISSRVCPACGSTAWKPFLATATKRIMTGDQRIVSGDLRKIACMSCGVVANKRAFDDSELELLYGEAYELNTLEGEEHQFFTSSGPIPRSQIFFDWILPHIPKESTSLLEIGCGSGNVLQRFSEKFRHKKIFGIDGSHRACAIARAKGLCVEQQLVTEYDTNLPNTDVVYSIAVLEHVENIPLFLSALNHAVSSRGRMIYCVPIQDDPGHDIFFAEHVWHLTYLQWIALFERCNLDVLHSERDHPINPGFGLFVCQRAIGNKTPAKFPEPNKAVINRDYWQDTFERIDQWLARHSNERMAIFGCGEVTTLFLTFTSLGDREIVGCIDEDKAKIGTKKHGIPVYGPEWLGRGEVDTVMLTINPRYHEKVVKKLKPYQLEIFSYSKES